MRFIKIITLATFCIFITQNKAAAQIDLEEGLIAFYPFNGNANDESGNDFDAMEIDSPTLSPDCMDTPNSAYLFNGVNDYIEISNTDDLNFSQSSIFTIALWIKVPVDQVDLDGGVNDLMSKWDGDASHPYSFNMRIFNQTEDRSGKISFGQYDSRNCGNNPTIISNRRVNDNKWHHVVLMRGEQTLLKLYIDGVIQGSLASNIQCDLVNDSNILFGLRYKDFEVKRAFLGALDNIRFYNRSLTEDEIQYLFNKELTDTEELISVPDIRVFPNPVVEGRLMVRNPSRVDIESIQVFNALGKEVIFEKDDLELDMRGLKTGIYFLRISIKGGKFIVRKIVNVNPGYA
jgi:hypothetical protein